MPITEADWISSSSSYAGYYAYIKKHFKVEMARLKSDYGGQRSGDLEVLTQNQ